MNNDALILSNEEGNFQGSLILCFSLFSAVKKVRLKNITHHKILCIKIYDINYHKLFRFKEH